MIFTFRKLYWKLIKMTIVFSFCVGSCSIQSLFTECAIFGLLFANCTMLYKMFWPAWLQSTLGCTTHIQQNRTITVTGLCAKSCTEQNMTEHKFLFRTCFHLFLRRCFRPLLLVLCNASDEGQLVQSAHRCHQLTMLLLLTHFSYSHLLCICICICICISYPILSFRVFVFVYPILSFCVSASIVINFAA